MQRAQSLRAEELLERARDVSASLMKERFADIDLGDIKVGWYPGHGTMGLIFRPDLIERAGMEPLMKTATDISAKFPEFALDGSARVTFGRDFGTMGFFPREMVELGPLW